MQVLEWMEGEVELGGMGRGKEDQNTLWEILENKDIT